MKKSFCTFLATVLIVALSGSLLMAASPWDERSIYVNTGSTNEDDEKEVENTKISETKTEEDNEKEEKATIKGTVTAGELNVRSAPWGDIIGTLNNGENVDIIDTIGDWYKINYKGGVGYIHGNWVSTADKQGQTSAKYGVVSNCYWLNVRRTPAGDILTQYQSGTKVYILGEAGDWYKIKYNNNEAFVSKKYIDITDGNSESSSTTGSSKSDSSFTGYVNACALNVRIGPWGDILGCIEKGDEVEVTGKNGDWYTINYNGQTAYVSAKYIYNSKIAGDNSDNPSNYSNATSAGNGTLQEKVVNSARSLVGSTNFRGADVAYGSKACAKVATTALKNAGALDKVYLNCRDSVKALKKKGWVEVTPPPYQEGDVITWKTYDYTGDGIKDDDTHIGIIVKEGNTYKVMNNSSKYKTPRITNINIAPISRVLRKA